MSNSVREEENKTLYDKAAEVYSPFWIQNLSRLEMNPTIGSKTLKPIKFMSLL